MELWKYANGLEQRIQVSNLGNAKTKERVLDSNRKGTTYQKTQPSRVISPWIGNHGYRTIAIKIGPKRPKFLLHRLVAMAFVPGYEPELTVNHINGNKLDNRAENLEWVTLAQNTKLQWRDGLVNLRGENHPSSKLTSSQVQAIKANLQSEQSTVVELAKQHKVSASAIYQIKRGIRWKHLPFVSL